MKEMGLNNSDNLEQGKRNAVLFLLPLILNIDDNYLNLYNKGLLGFFYKDTNKPEWEDKIIIAYEYNTPLRKVDEFFKNNKNSFESYSEHINGKHYKIYAFTVPFEFKKDYKHLTKGDYKCLSVGAKIKLTQHWNNQYLAKKISHYISGYKSCWNTHYDFVKTGILNLNNVPV